MPCFEIPRWLAVVCASQTGFSLRCTMVACRAPNPTAACHIWAALRRTVRRQAVRFFMTGRVCALASIELLSGEDPPIADSPLLYATPDCQVKGGNLTQVA